MAICASVQRVSSPACDAGNVASLLIIGIGAAFGLTAVGAYASTLGDVLFADGFEESCDIDTDNDRLVNCLEVANGTSLTDPDTDDDGLGDGDEVLGTLGGLNLPALGVNPRRKDVLIEHDWTDDSVDCVAHSHRPPEVALEELRQMFAAAPVSNQNGQSGINMINDFGQGGVFAGGNAVSIPDGTIQGDVLGLNFQSVKSGNFGNNRLGYFHYALHAHRYTSAPGSSGNAEVLGDDLMVTLQCAAIPDFVLKTTMHEIGHNLALLHGGGTECNYKPNYNSIMNYEYQFPGIDTNCDRFGDGPAGYSTGVRAILNESAIFESIGVCGGVPLDWNGNGTIEDGIQADVNGAGNNTCGGQFTVLTDYNDWSNLIVASLPGTGGGGPTGSVLCQDTPTLR